MYSYGMKKFIFGFMFALFFYGASNAEPLAIKDKDARAAHLKIKAKKIILVGDSTTQILSGWGGEFCARHLISSVACINLARGGRSSFSYRAEGSWDIALSEINIKSYDEIYMLIQLGHNDMPGKPGRSTDLETEFPIFMEKYVKEAKKSGAKPILITPLVRRSFKNNILVNDLIPWSEAIKKIAKAQNVPLIDLNKLSAEAVQNMGALNSLDLAQIPPNQDIINAAKTGTTIDAPKPVQIINCLNSPITQKCDTKDMPPKGKPNGKVNRNFDYTHLGENGAKIISAIVAKGLAEAVPELSNYILE